MPTATPRRLFPLNMRWWHKWIGISIGLLLLGWVLSGIFMLLPQSNVAKLKGISDPMLDFSKVVISPTQAALIAVAARPDSSHDARGDSATRSVTLKTVLGTTVYMVTPKRGQAVLVEATSGAIYSITPDRAKEIAGEALPGAKAIGLVRHEGRPYGYYGATPVYEVAFDDAAATVAMVAKPTGDLVRDTRVDRVLHSIGYGFHAFMPFVKLPGGDNTRKLSLIFTGAISLLSIVTGYWLSVPKRWLKRKS